MNDKERHHQAILEEVRASQLIPPLPRVVDELRAECRDGCRNLTAVTGIVSRDPSLAGLMLVAVNHLEEGGRSTISSVGQAVRMLGERRVTELVGEYLKVQRERGAAEVPLERFWEQSKLRAEAAFLVAGYVGREAVRDEAFSAGLLLDCGIPVMARRWKDYRVTLGKANRNRTRNTDLEDNQYHLNHAQVGGKVAEKLWLSDASRLAILHHHDPNVFISYERGINRQVLDLVAILRMAEYIVDSLKNRTTVGDWSAFRPRAMRQLGLNDARFQSMKQRVLRDLKRAEEQAKRKAVGR